MATSGYLLSLLLVAVVISVASAQTRPSYKVSHKKWSCKPWEWTCNNGWQCIKKHLACDGKVHCKDGSDESKRSCTWTYPGAKRCARGLFVCNNGQCVEWRYVCDKTNNCGNNRDERKGLDCLKGKASRGDSKSRATINKCKTNPQYCQKHPRLCGLKTPFNCRKIYRPNRPLSKIRPWALKRPWE